MKKHLSRFITILTRRSRALVLPALLLALTLPASAQWRAGISLGYTHNKLDTDPGYAYDLRHDSRGGFTVGIPVQYNFTDWFGLRAEALFVQKAYSTYRTGIYNQLYTNTCNSYLQFPIMANFSFGGERLRGFVNAGGFLGGWLSSHQKGTTIRYFSEEDGDESGQVTPENEYRFDEKVPFDSRRDNRFEAGLTGGLGISYRVLSYLTLELEGRCYYSLTDMQKNYMKFGTPRYNTTFVLQAGCFFTFGQSK